ncbi:PE-PGRS family protein [Streptomyces sp. NPDC006476]|uniref:McrC family protein n=1 Tax=Streptomyces sp. NPDC006476 TaxID=3157175 RepID=UPI0033B3E78D
MPDRAEIRIGEYQSAPLDSDRLTPRDVERLRALEAGRHLTLAPDRSGWRLRAGATVGVLVLDRVRLVIEPKFAIPGERLMSWLAYALNAPAPVRVSVRRWTTEPDGYADLVAAALLEQCEQLVREGLRRDYVRHDGVEPVLRGRLDVAAQATRRYGQLDRLHIRTFDRETDIWDNRVLATALKAAFVLTGSPDLARDLHGITGAFPRPAVPAATLHALDRISYTRLNARYRPAHTWARLLLNGGGVTDLLADQGNSADGLLLAMPALWEAVVRRLGTEAGVSLGGRALSSGGDTAITVRGDLGNASTFRPDLLLSLPLPGTSQRALLPVDAKYKRYDRHGVSADDVHQLLTYSAGYTPSGDPCGVIIHPRSEGHTHRVLQVGGPRGRLGTIHVLGVDTQADPGHASAWIRAALP